MLTRATWGLFALGAVTIFAGTAATAAGPHTGGTGTDDLVPRLVFKGADTLNWVISQHARLATLLGLAAVGVWIVARRRGVAREQLAPLTWLCVLLAAQGVDRRRAVRARAARGDRLGARLAGGRDVGGDRLDGGRRGRPAGDRGRAPASPSPCRRELKLSSGRARTSRATVSAATSVAPLTTAMPSTL